VFAFVLALAGVASAQLTTITAAHISMGGVPIATGKVYFTPVNAAGQPIAFVSGGGGLNSPQAFSCTITAGAITGSCQIPDAALTTPTNLLYMIDVSAPSISQTFRLPIVPNVTGTTWALDSYAPSSATTNSQTVQVTYGASAPPSPCATPSFYYQTSVGLSVCVGGVPVPVGAVSVSVVGVGAPALSIGDSHAQGFGTVIPTAQGYAAQTAAFRGWNFTNAAVGGYKLIDLYTEYPWSRPVGQSTVTLIDAAVNDAIAMSVQQGGGAATLNAGHSSLMTQMQQAWIVISGVTDTHRQLADEGALTGSWQPLANVAPGFPGFFEWSATSGDSANYSCTGTRCDLVVVNTTDIQGNFTVTVDGTPVVCAWPSGTTTCGGRVNYTGLSAYNAAIYDIPMRGLTNGSHTIHVVNTTGGGTAIVAAYGSAASDVKPLVAVANLTFARSASNANLADSLVTAQQPLLTTMYNTMLSDGFNLVPINYTVAPTSYPSGTQSNYWWNPNDTAQTYSDGLHPNFLGYQHIANELEFLLLGK
jgi:hypothetical protein